MRPVLQYVHRDGILDLGWGHPLDEALPVTEWAEATAQALRRYGPAALTYGYGAGPGPLVEWLAAHLGDTDPGQLFVTAGASHALELVTQHLLRAGDVVVADSPTYHLALRILGDRGVEVVPAPRDPEGLFLDVDGVREVVERARAAGRRVPLLYLVPTFGNPTGASLPDDRRVALVRLAGTVGLTIVEDDTYRELFFEAPAPASLWSLAAGGEVIRIGSFAKTVAPGLRLGFVTAPAEVVARLAGLGYVDSGGGVNHTTALAMATFGESGGYASHVARLRALYAGQRDVLVGALRSAAPSLPEVPTPGGGWFLWLPLPPGVTGTALLPAAEEHGVSFVEGNRFHVGGVGGDDRVRLAYSMLPPEDLITAATRFGAALNHT
jgi:2-aminoadipate transaminase